MNLLPPVVLETGSTPTDVGHKNLACRWIDGNLAEAAGIRRVNAGIGASFMGRRDNGSYDGLLIPYIPPGESRVREWRLRRDRPEIEYKAGKPKERGKCLSPPGCRNMIYFAPGVSPELFNDARLPIVITEGEFKTLALWRLANHDS